MRAPRRRAKRDRAKPEQAPCALPAHTEPPAHTPQRMGFHAIVAGDLRGVPGVGRRSAVSTLNGVNRLEHGQVGVRGADIRGMIAAELFAAASDPSMSLQAKLERMLRIGCEGLGFELGIVSRSEGDRYEVVAVHAPGDLEIGPGATFALGETYCRDVLEATVPMGFDSAADPHWADHPAHERFGLEAYLGARIRVLGRVFGTLNFSSREARPSPVDGQTRRVIAQLAHWIGTELEREELAAGLRRSEEMMRGVLSTSLDGIMVFESVRDDGGEITFKATVRIDTPIEVEYYRHGGVLQYVLRQMLNDGK